MCYVQYEHKRMYAYMQYVRVRTIVPKTAYTRFKAALNFYALAHKE